LGVMTQTGVLEDMMKVRDIMSADVEVARPNQSAKDVAERMRQQGIGYFPVCDHGRLVGIITDRDIVCRIVATGRDASSTKLRDIMSKGAAYCFDDDDLTTAVQLMEQNRIRRIPVIGHDEHLLGILSLTDVARHAPSRLTADIVVAVSSERPLSVTINPASEILE
jgi:CBS domain-containing protein